MHRSTSRSPLRRAITLAAVALCGLPLVLSAQGAAEPPRPQELRQQLMPLYQQLETDPQFQALRDQVAQSAGDSAAIDRVLSYMPISPKAWLEIDMFVHRYEIMVPPHILAWHKRWVELHPQAAREQYGEEAVAALLPPPEAAAGAAPEATVGTNRNVANDFPTTPDDYQGEIQVAVNPNNPNQIVAAANTFDSIGGTCSGPTQAIFYSSDGGTTWGYTCSPDDSGYTGLNCTGVGFVFGSDPAVAWDSSGNVYLNEMLLCSPDGFSTRFSIVVARSTDGGATWSGHGVLKNSWSTSNLEDKNFYAIDNTPASPFFGRHYACWDRNNNEKLAFSSDGGASWTEVDLPTSPGAGSRFDLACEIAVGSDGTVHVIFDTLTCAASCSNEEMFYTQSTDGGATFSAAVEIADFNLVGFSNVNCPDAQDDRCINPFGAIGVDNSGGACDGNLYVTFSDWTSGGVNNNDVWTIRSTDNGATWSSPLRVNDDGDGAPLQFHPFLQVDSSDGSVVVAWHDTRNDPQADEVDYYVARSIDCGLSFETNIQASQPSAEFNNSGISFTNLFSGDNPQANPNQYGEYLGLDVLGGKAYLAWTDTRHYFPSNGAEVQKENLGFAVVQFGSAEIFTDGFESGDTSAWSNVVP